MIFRSVFLCTSSIDPVIVMFVISSSHHPLVSQTYHGILSLPALSKHIHNFATASPSPIPFPLGPSLVLCLITQYQPPYRCGRYLSHSPAMTCQKFIRIVFLVNVTTPWLFPPPFHPYPSLYPSVLQTSPPFLTFAHLLHSLLPDSPTTNHSVRPFARSLTPPTKLCLIHSNPPSSAATLPHPLTHFYPPTALTHPTFSQSSFRTAAGTTFTTIFPCSLPRTRAHLLAHCFCRRRCLCSRGPQTTTSGYKSAQKIISSYYFFAGRIHVSQKRSPAVLCSRLILF